MATPDFCFYLGHERHFILKSTNNESKGPKARQNQLRITSSCSSRSCVHISRLKTCHTQFVTSPETRVNRNMNHSQTCWLASAPQGQIKILI